MACKTSFELYHNFPKVAEESGFAFNTHKPRVHIEWNKIKLVDIENLVRQRKFITLEHHINDILDCALESEFDVKILDEGVVKIFRLAQLVVEYQQFCRHYLDRSVYVLREEITSLLKELDNAKKKLRDKEEENRKLKRKHKHYIRTPLPYENENIATMLLKTFNKNHGEMLPSQVDVTHYNKCDYCEKIFLNQIYLKSHISRRHTNTIEVPQKDIENRNLTSDIAKSNVNDEIAELKNKLKQMEDIIANKHISNKTDLITTDNQEQHLKKPRIDILSNNDNLYKEMKDAEVLTNEDTYILNKFEEWKKEEFEKYNKEITLLRNQIIDILSKKEKQDQYLFQNELKDMEQLQKIIKQQGAEITSLKEELLKRQSHEQAKKEEFDNQMSYWIKQTEIQSDQYKILLQKLNDVANESREYRTRADTEREKYLKLQQMLQEKKEIQNVVMTDSPLGSSSPINIKSERGVKKLENTKKNVVLQGRPTVKIKTLKKLQQQAQELLNIDQTSSSESSSASNHRVSSVHLSNKEIKRVSSEALSHKCDGQRMEKVNKLRDNTNRKLDAAESVKNREKKLNIASKMKSKCLPHLIEKNQDHLTCSPMKVVRAKITEEVNHSLTSLGVDPLKNRLPSHIFEKQRNFWLKERELKTKKFSGRDKILHSIIANLDQYTNNTDTLQKKCNISPAKSNKTFSISSVFTNVKTKALSLVKPNESINKSERMYNDVAKKAIALLKTPPISAHSSPLRNETNLTSPYEKLKDAVLVKCAVRDESLRKAQKKEVNMYEESDTNDDNSSMTGNNIIAINQGSKTVNSAITSPVHRTIDNIAHAKLNVGKYNPKDEVVTHKLNIAKENESSEELESLNLSPRKYFSEENISSVKQTKGVLKQASSTSSLNKKKVLFDMDAIQMKSVSASPSQSLTDKSENMKGNPESANRISLDTEEWDISSLENEPSRSPKVIKSAVNSSTKVANLKKTIESKLAYRSPSLSTALVGGVDVLGAPVQKAVYFGGSNTSLGSSILDETDNVPVQNNKLFINTKAAEKDDSEVEISDLINDAVDGKNYIKSF